jgi:hypothetical protein
MYKNIILQIPEGLNSKEIGQFLEKAGDGIEIDWPKRQMRTTVSEERIKIIKTLAEEFGITLISEKSI